MPPSLPSDRASGGESNEITERWGRAWVNAVGHHIIKKVDYGPYTTVFEPRYKRWDEMQHEDIRVWLVWLALILRPLPHIIVTKVLRKTQIKITVGVTYYTPADPY
jgi:hypothetical protein